MSTAHPLTKPANNAEWARQVQQRLRRLEARGTVRIGSWTLTEDGDGNLMAVNPSGQSLDVGNLPAIVAAQAADRGYVTTTQVANALSGNTTSDIVQATQIAPTTTAAVGTAQSSANSANAGVAAIQAQLSAGGGISVDDSFDRAAAANTLGTDYTRTADGNPGTWGTDGAGNVVATLSSSVAHDLTDRHNTPTTTLYQQVTAIMPTPPARSGSLSANHSTLNLCGRCSTDNATRVEAIVSGGSTVELGYRLAGSYSRFSGAVANVTLRPGDRWDFMVGDPDLSDEWDFTVLQNNVTVLEHNDSGHLSSVADMYCALGVHFGVTVAFYLTKQIGPGVLGEFIFNDRS